MKILRPIVCFIIGIICVVEGRSLIQKRQAQWKPSDGRSAEEWKRCHGMTEEVCQRVQNKMNELNEAISGQVHTQDNSVPAKDVAGAPMKLSEETGQTTPRPSVSPESLHDFILTEQQIDWVLAHLVIENETTKTNGHDSHKRQKRQLLDDFASGLVRKWSTSIKYKFDGTQSDSQKSTIRGAFQHWSDNTCVRYQEVETTAQLSDDHLILTNDPIGCSSFIGRVGIKPQRINFQDTCRFGSIVHEIGHSLGLLHQQQRSDRDKYITVNLTNVLGGYVNDLYRTLTYNVVNYNYGSVMHYGSKGNSSVNGYDTMVAKNPLYQQNMGQRTGLSYEDIKAINIAYCSQSCSTPLPMSCERGGYQDPNNCSRCICPDGFSGTYCQLVAESSDENIGGIMNLASGDERTIKSPGYDSVGYYLSHTYANWLIKAPVSHIVQLRFTGDFGIYCQDDACFHWVEVKYKADLGLEGARFCCNARPLNVTVMSESNEMMIVFKSNFSSKLSQQRGFQAVVTAVPLASASSPIKTSSSTTTTSSSATTTTTVTTTHPPTTTTMKHAVLGESVSSDVPPSSSTSTMPTSATSTRTTTTQPATTMTSKSTVPGESVSSDVPSSSSTSTMSISATSTTQPPTSTKIRRPVSSTSMSSNVPSSSSSTTSAAAASTTTTQSSPVTTTEVPASLAAGTKLWSCSFEQPENVLCGMTQDQTDQFDWTVFSGPTPSELTGPDSAYDGKYYIYIEASDPRKPNDEARLFVPKFDYTGTVCIDFYYHMYGFHINTLKWDRITPTQTSTVWSRSHDMGNQWNHGTVQVDLPKDSQVRLTASRGQAYSGDIGVDALRISAGPCH